MNVGIVSQLLTYNLWIYCVATNLFIKSNIMNNQIKIIVTTSLIVIGFYLLTEHRAHLFGNAQYILFGIFILLHFFMYAGHGGHGEQKKGKHQHE